MICSNKKKQTQHVFLQASMNILVGMFFFSVSYVTVMEVNYLIQTMCPAVFIHLIPYYI
jgi:hypothetical protein